MLSKRGGSGSVYGSSRPNNGVNNQSSDRQQFAGGSSRPNSGVNTQSFNRQQPVEDSSNPTPFGNNNRGNNFGGGGNQNTPNEFRGNSLVAKYKNKSTKTTPERNGKANSDDVENTEPISPPATYSSAQGGTQPNDHDNSGSNAGGFGNALSKHKAQSENSTGNDFPRQENSSQSNNYHRNQREVTGSNATPVGQGNRNNFQQGGRRPRNEGTYQRRDGHQRDGNNFQQKDGEEGKEKRPRNINVDKLRNAKQRGSGFIPYERTVEDIVKEDVDSESLYKSVFENDEEIEVTGNDFDPVYMDQWADCAQLNKSVLKNIEKCKYVHPRKIQSYVIPLIFEGRDICAQAETGSGKTVAYLVPLISMIEDEKAADRSKIELRMPRAIIIGPTRELIIQLYEQALKLSTGTDVKVRVAYGEYDFSKNSVQVFKGCDILITTYGRLLHFLDQSVVGLERLKYLVLDEADHLMQKQFKADYELLIKTKGFPKDNLQTMLFSATFPERGNDLVRTVFKSRPITVKNVRANIPNLRITQTFEECDKTKKIVRFLDYVQEIIAKHQKEMEDTTSLPKILAFVQECAKSDIFAFFLNENEIPALSLNSKRGQRVREETLEAFRNNQVAVIVATDVCARGLEIKNLDYIINVDLPISENYDSTCDDYATYVMRVGRTGRLKHGYAHTFFDPEVDFKIAVKLVKALEHEKLPVPEFLKKVKYPVSNMFPPLVAGNFDRPEVVEPRQPPFVSGFDG